MRLTPACPDLADERLRGRVEARRYAVGRLARIVAPSAPLRRRPASDAPLDTEALMGEMVTVFDEADGYAWVQLAADRYVGYLPGSVLGEAGPDPTHRVQALRTFIYPGPDLKLPPAAFLSFGAGVTAAGPERDGYLPLSTGGFVFVGHVVALDAVEPDFVAVAERFLGTPYLWGGKTSLGLDCSGLVQLALAAAGIACPRDSDMQEAALGRLIELPPDLSGLRRGDLVFWRGHMGVMLDPERLLHANGHHMAVAIEPLFAAERRIRGNSFGPITSVRRLEAASRA